jgi:hypothetical protein
LVEGDVVQEVRELLWERVIQLYVVGEAAKQVAEGGVELGVEFAEKLDLLLIFETIECKMVLVSATGWLVGNR